VVKIAKTIARKNIEHHQVKNKEDDDKKAKEPEFRVGQKILDFSPLAPSTADVDFLIIVGFLFLFCRGLLEVYYYVDLLLKFPLHQLFFLSYPAFFFSKLVLELLNHFLEVLIHVITVLCWWSTAMRPNPPNPLERMSYSWSVFL
jgi:hypothetical protein